MKYSSRNVKAIVKSMQKINLIYLIEIHIDCGFTQNSAFSKLPGIFEILRIFWWQLRLRGSWRSSPSPLGVSERAAYVGEQLEAALLSHTVHWHIWIDFGQLGWRGRRGLWNVWNAQLELWKAALRLLLAALLFLPLLYTPEGRRTRCNKACTCRFSTLIALPYARSLVLKYRTSTPPQIILIFESSFTLTLSFANEIIMRESKVTKDEKFLLVIGTKFIFTPCYLDKNPVLPLFIGTIRKTVSQ